MFADIRTASYGLKKIFSAGWKIYAGGFRDIMLVTLIVYIPINIILSFVPSGPEELEGFRLKFRVAQLLDLFIGVLATIAVAKITECAVNGEKVGYAAALKFGISRWGRCISVQILAGLIIFGLLLLLIVPGIIWAVYYTFGVLVVALRGINGKEALDYSKRLVKGQWGRVFGINFVIGVMMLLTIFILSFTLALPMSFVPENWLLNVVSDTVLDVVMAMFWVMSVVFFLNVDYLKPEAKADPQES
ncbi:MAG: hypothetical protein PHC68_10530 [Syntrophorhabdaceae bacterium]|nr:hypothetical protein [Syntrophorhabdaceae bacterium]